MPRSELGATWWAQRWVGALEAIGWHTRLSRGRTYARTGRVVSIKITPGLVAARVRGSRPTPYRTTIRLRPLDETVWNAVFDRLAQQAGYAARLLAEEMPRDIDEAFEAEGVSLVPRSGDELVSECSCPDWENPCKHIAAVHYVLGAQLDHDPFLLFELRGKSRERVLQALRDRRSFAVSPETPSDGAEETGVQGDPPLEAVLDRFWQAGPELVDVSFELRPPRVPYSILKRLGPVVGPPDGRAFDPELAALYERVSRRALGAAYEGAEEG
jgi:uncharacterized Zn finger protein